MSWLGFLPKPAAATAASSASASSSSSAAASTSSAPAAAHSAEEEWSDEKPQVRMLTPKEMEKLQAENEQLRDILRQMAAAAKAEGAAYPSLNPDQAASSPVPPSSFVFHRMSNISSNASSRSSSCAMPAASAPGAEVHAQPEGGDFYAALRQSLAKETQQQSSSAGASNKTLEDEEETDDWDAPSSTSARAPDSLHAPRTADEAIVHSKNASIIVRKKPLRPKLSDDDGGSSIAAAAAPPTTTTGEDELDDFAEFGPEATAGVAAAGAHAALASAEEEGEEIAIISDLTAADWWHVVPHPDRPGEALEDAQSTPPDPQEDEDGFVVVRGQDSLLALGEFLSSLMAKHPEIRRLSPEQLRALIDQSLTDAGVKEPSAIGKAWQWGKSAYTVWSYGAWGLSLYRNETFVRVVAAGIIKAATWTAIFFI